MKRPPAEYGVCIGPPLECTEKVFEAADSGFSNVAGSPFVAVWPLWIDIAGLGPITKITN
jgi:hypothetical protein